MGPVLVVMPAVGTEHVLEMLAAEDEDPVETVGADGSHPAFGVGVRVWRLDGRADHLDDLGAEDLVEGVAELLVAIVDEESEGLVISEFHDQVARLLGDPASVRTRGTGDVLDSSRRQRDEEEDVEPLQELCLDGEEVAGERARRLLAQECSPRWACSLGRRRQTGADQHLAYRGRRDGDAETLELADDAAVPPVAVLARESKDQGAQRPLERRPPRGPCADMSSVVRQAGDASSATSAASPESRPRPPRQRAAQRGQERAVSSGDQWTAGLPTQDLQLVSEDQDLQFLRATRAGQQRNEREQIPDDEIDKRPEQARASHS